MSTGPDKHGVADATPCECDYGFQSNAITKAKECMPPDAWGAWDPVTKLPRVGCLDSVNRADHARFKGHWGQGGATVQATLWVVGLDDEAGAIEELRETLPESHRWAVTRRRCVVLLRYLGQERNEAWALCQQAWELIRPRLTGQPLMDAK